MRQMFLFRKKVKDMTRSNCEHKKRPVSVEDVRQMVQREHDSYAKEVAMRFTRGNVHLQFGDMLMSEDLEHPHI